MYFGIQHEIMKVSNKIMAGIIVTTPTQQQLNSTTTQLNLNLTLHKLGLTRN